MEKENLVEGMRETLGTAFSLYVMSHTAHWNCEGPLFFETHKMLELIYQEIWGSLDDIAEHLRALDAYTPMTMTRFSELSQIPDCPPAPFSSREMLVFLVNANETMIQVLLTTLHLAEEVDEQGLVNFLGGRIEAHQKHRWMLRASAKPQRH